MAHKQSRGPGGRACTFNMFVEWTHNGGHCGRHSLQLSAPLRPIHGRRYTYRSSMRVSFIAFFWLIALPIASQAQFKDENLLQKLPPGYKIAMQTKQGNTAITQMIPEGESIKNWSETLAVNVFLGERSATVEQFQQFSLTRWVSGCPGVAGASEVKTVSKGNDNGYPFAVWSVACKRPPESGLSEFAWFKAIKGNDSFYVIQKSFRAEPSQEVIANWVQYLRKLSVCDTRLADRKCPVLDDVGK
jgi:hypothetical protein